MVFDGFGRMKRGAKIAGRAHLPSGTSGKMRHAAPLRQSLASPIILQAAHWRTRKKTFNRFVCVLDTFPPPRYATAMHPGLPVCRVPTETARPSENQSNMTTEPPQPPNVTLLAALYQVTARWYANDAQLVWRRLSLFVTLNTGLLGTQVFASHLHLGVRIALPLLGIFLTAGWFFLLRRAWRYQDFQAAVLRDQEVAMGLSHLGAFSRSRTIRDGTAMQISNEGFSRNQLASWFRNRHFTLFLLPVFIGFHCTLLIAAIAGIDLREAPTPVASMRAAKTNSAPALGVVATPPASSKPEVATPKP